METPRISVLLPCFNDGAWLDDAVGSVLDQTYRRHEILIVDDGSTDPATVETLKRWTLPGSRVLRTANRGLPAARNHAAAHATGDFFCALDADDRLAPTWFEKAIGVLDADPDCAFVSHWLEAFGDERWTWKPERCDLPALLARNTVNGAALVRRSAFEAVGGYEETMREGCEDWDFWLRLVERGFRGTILPEVLFHYRRRAGSMSRMMTDAARYRLPLETLVSRHEAAYRQHLVAVMLAAESEALDLRSELGSLVRDEMTVLQPQLDRAREELTAAREKVDRLRPTVEALRDRERFAVEARELRREVAALRSSWSWRLTAPIRKAWGWFLRFQR
ncbi:MAG TPA: glycosyltransferase [Vicinamibacterales bacterium]|nr:glycosyltransferase [Vicinamibacterales bacterium]